MVKYQDEPLDRVFSALADPTRRALVARLEQKESLTISELAEPFPVSLPAIMKHLDVLSDAGLITRHKSGRTVNCQLTAATMKSAPAVPATPITCCAASSVTGEGMPLSCVRYRTRNERL